MTKFMNKTFTNYANYSEPVCSGCGREEKVYYVYENERYCTSCEEIRRENKKQELIKKLSKLEK